MSFIHGLCKSVGESKYDDDDGLKSINIASYYKLTNFVKALDRSDRLDNDAGSVALKPDLSQNKTRCIVEYQLDTSDDQNKTNILVVTYYHHHYCYHFNYLNRYYD